MEIVHELLSVNSENVFRFVANVDLFRKYCDPKMRYNTVFSSPFRKDNHPSFVIYEKGFFVDFASGERGNGITFVMMLFNINYNQALLKIIYDFELSESFNCFNTIHVPNKVAEFENPRDNLSLAGGSDIQVKRRAFNEADLTYWKKYNIEEQDLNFAKIIAISHYFINGKMFIAEKLAYAFIENKDNVVTVKVYQPLSKFIKWINNNGGSVWELWSQLPDKGDHAFITSSRKDALAVMKVTGIPATALQAESTKPKEQVMREFLSRFKKVYLFYDNDYDKEKNWGQIAARKIKDTYPAVRNIFIPSEHKSKDFSDLIDNYGSDFAKSVLRSVIKTQAN